MNVIALNAAGQGERGLLASSCFQAITASKHCCALICQVTRRQHYYPAIFDRLKAESAMMAVLGDENKNTVSVARRKTSYQ